MTCPIHELGSQKKKKEKKKRKKVNNETSTILHSTQLDQNTVGCKLNRFALFSSASTWPTNQAHSS